MTLSDTDKALYLERALKTADWFVNSQLGDYRPNWNADRGRFLYYYYMPEQKHVPGINWTMGRGLFVLSEAYKLSGEARYLDAAKLGAAYIDALQVMDPFYGRVRGAIKEETPQGNWGGMLDGAQAASGLLMLEKVTGDERYLRQGRAFCDFLVTNFDPDKGGLPAKAIFYPEEDVVYADFGHLAMAMCSAIPLWHLYKRTGEKQYLPPLIFGADHILTCQRDDGAFYYRPNPQAHGIPRINHHEGRGEGDDIYVLRNDDAIMVVVLGAYLATKDSKYLDAAVRYAEWIASQTPSERPFCAFPIQCNNLLDIGRASGRDWSEWVLDHLQKHLLDLQVLNNDDPRAEGGFRGEDEENEGGIFGGTSLDYVTTRVSCYSAGTLLRLSGKGTGAGFSAWGIE